ncbi:MAG: hypothetical protein K9J37_07810 [Saprospiraceae bacterium]|nr:hypothetical protein [Saprospiraceae bacterium]MCF8249803.1 hypothetical protein [Saprospiraceae bacterium]MCF8279288.1 hypothetical protein [Bacteroidales bacterium]MCF8313446.1 hypothetical protein [Saprospiraceae bacterium]MCF8442159.1 hypothetical protein [Saprospiraceae bacterium]
MIINVVVLDIIPIFNQVNRLTWPMVVGFRVSVPAFSNHIPAKLFEPCGAGTWPGYGTFRLVPLCLNVFALKDCTLNLAIALNPTQFLLKVLPSNSIYESKAGKMANWASSTKELDMVSKQFVPTSIPAHILLQANKYDPEMVSVCPLTDLILEPGSILTMQFVKEKWELTVNSPLMWTTMFEKPVVPWLWELVFPFSVTLAGKPP